MENKQCRVNVKKAQTSTLCPVRDNMLVESGYFSEKWRAVKYAMCFTHISFLYGLLPWVWNFGKGYKRLMFHVFVQIIGKITKSLFQLISIYAQKLKNELSILF